MTTDEQARARIAELERERDEARAEVERWREALLAEADYCFGYAAKYEESDPARAARHRKRGERLRRTAINAARKENTD